MTLPTGRGKKKDNRHDSYIQSWEIFKDKREIVKKERGKGRKEKKELPVYRRRACLGKNEPITSYQSSRQSVVILSCTWGM